MAPLKLNFRMASTSSRSTSQESSSENATATLIDYSQAPQSSSQSQSFPRTGKLLSTGTQSTTTITGSSSPSMESFEENQLTRGDRSALLQNDSFYPTSSHQEQIAYDNPTVLRDQFEEEESPSPAITCPTTQNEHVLIETRLLCTRDGPSTSTTTTTSSPLNVVCPHHSPRIDSDETQSSQLSESDSESQYIEKCCCQLANASMQDVSSHSALVGTMEQQQHQLAVAGPSASSAVEAATNAAVAAGVDPDVITLEASDTYPEEMFTAWHHGTVQGGEIEISNKCSKRLYKLMAAEGRGICKMSSECRCDECQSNYFDCDFDNNEHQKTDGGLGAGTPMFINEVMHGAACNIL